MKKLVVLGNGGYSRTLQDVAEQLRYNILAVLDDKDEQHLDHPQKSRQKIKEQPRRNREERRYYVNEGG